MRVLALETEPSATRGGQEHSLLEVCTGLAREGHEVALTHLLEGDLLPRYAEAGVTTVRVDSYAVDRSRTLRSGALVLGSLARALRIPADVVYINQYHDVLFAATLARLKRLPLVCHLRLFPPENLCGQWRLGLSAVSRFIAVSDATRKAYVDTGFAAGAIDVVLNGVDVSRFRPLREREDLRARLGLAPNDFAVLFVGRIDRGKNIEGLLRSFADLRRDSPNAQLLVAGRPLNHVDAAAGQRYLQSLHELASTLGITGAVRWLGPRTDVVELYNAVDVCALFSSHPETFGRTVAEAMACGTPAVATAIGGIPEVMLGEFAGSTFSPDDSHAGANRLRALVDWRQRDPGLGARARAMIVERFDARRVVHEVAGILERSVAEGAVRRGPQLRAARSSDPLAALAQDVVTR